MIINGHCLEEMLKMEPNSIDFIVTDPPYGLHFMGKHWDKELPAVDVWEEAFRICKPGSMIAAFGGSRTHHHLMIALEKADFEIRDVIMWLFGSGLPKSHNHFEFPGYGTGLKPAYEPIILAMKPLDGTFKQNAEKWGVGGINIEASRIETNDYWNRKALAITKSIYGKRKALDRFSNPMGRWPANIILDEETAQAVNEQSGELKRHIEFRDSRGASRFFYCSKASSKERGKGNNHLTVKPLSLMKYIITLLAPPGDPLLLDPFAGSGSTLVAAKELGIRFIGIEKEKEYCEIANARISSAKREEKQYDMFRSEEKAI